MIQSLSEPELSCCEAKAVTTTCSWILVSVAFPCHCTLKNNTGQVVLCHQDLKIQMKKCLLFFCDDSSTNFAGQYFFFLKPFLSMQLSSNPDFMLMLLFIHRVNGAYGIKIITVVAEQHHWFYNKS